MGTETEELLIKISADIADMKSKMEEAKQVTVKAKEEVSNFSKGLGMLKTAAAFMGVGLGIEALKSFAMECGEAVDRSDRLKSVLNNMLPVGQSYTQMVVEAKNATGGMMSETAIMSGGLAILQKGLASTSEEAGQLVGAGKILTTVFAESGASMEMYSRAIMTGQSRLLAKFGVTMQMVEAEKLHLQATTNLDGAELKQAATKAALIKRAEELKGAIMDDQAAEERLTAATEDLKVKIGAELDPAMDELGLTLANTIALMNQMQAPSNSTSVVMVNVTNSINPLAKAYSDLMNGMKQYNQLVGPMVTGTVDVGRAVVANDAGMRFYASGLKEATDAESEFVTREYDARGALMAYRASVTPTTEEVKKLTEEHKKLAEEQKAAFQGMASTLAGYANQLSELGKNEVESKKKYEEETLAAMTEAKKSQEELELNYNERVGEAAKDRADKERDAQMRSAESGNEIKNSQRASWDQYYTESISKTREAYDKETVAIQEKLTERLQVLETARNKEMEMQRVALEELKVKTALSVLENQGALESFTGGMAKSSTEAYALITSGLLPVNREMAMEMQNIMGGMTTTQQAAAERATANSKMMSAAIAGQLDETRGSVQAVNQDFSKLSNTIGKASGVGKAFAPVQDAVGPVKADTEIIDKLLVSVKGGAELAARAMSGLGDVSLQDLINQLRDIIRLQEEVLANNRAGAGGSSYPSYGPGYATGADFIVPPGYNNDKFGPLWVDSGEHVVITPANQVSNQNSNSYTLNIYGGGRTESLQQDFATLSAMNSGT